MSPSETPQAGKRHYAEWAGNVIASRQSDFDKLCQRFSKSPDAVEQSMGVFVSHLQGMLKKMGCPVSSAEDTAKAAELVGELRTQFEAKTGTAPDAGADTALIRPFALVHALVARVLNGPQAQEKSTTSQKPSKAQPLDETPTDPVEPPAAVETTEEGEFDWSEITGEKK